MLSAEHKIPQANDVVKGNVTVIALWRNGNVLMIIIKLKEAKLAYERRTGKRLTYAQLGERTGIRKRTLTAMANTPGYNASLDKLYLVCIALGALPSELLDLSEPDTARIVARREAWARGSKGVHEETAGGKERRKSTRGKKKRKSKGQA